ncbi:MAG: Gfo/Idh/MocA family oxidoreductase [Ruminococcaceae bacterium]|nr:Gfo/Idh/MocA family oxidoreductase [Oscillospiraceae bacterium]
MKKLRVAIIGQGRSGRNIHGAYFLSEQNTIVEVVAAVDAIADRRERAKVDFGCDVYEDYRELFGRKDIDLIVNASFSQQHYSIAKDCLEHGYNVLNEKPFAKTYYEAMDLIKTAEKHGVLVTAFHQSIYGPTIFKIKEILESGKLGNIKQINMCWSGFSRRWDWQTLQNHCAGGVYNTAPHPIGIALDLLGWDPDAKVAYSHLDTALTSGDANDMAKIIITAPGKPIVDIEVNSADAYPAKNIKILGDRGSLICGTTGDVNIKYIVDEELEARPVTEEPLRKPETGYPMYCSENLPFHEETFNTTGDGFTTASDIYYKRLYDTLVNGAPLYITAEKAAKAIEIIEAVHAENPLPLKY